MLSSRRVLQIQHHLRLEKSFQVRANTRACLHQGPFYKFCNVLDSRRNSHVTSKAHALARAEEPSISLQVKFRQVLEFAGFEGRLPFERQGPSMLSSMTSLQIL